MEFFPGAKNIFKAALNQNWEDVEPSPDNLLALISPLTEFNDSIIHFLVHSKRYSLLKKIVNQVCSLADVSLLSQANVDGNTGLHEAAISGNLEAVELLFGINTGLAEVKNNKGETPLFRAAAFGKTKAVKFLARHIHPDKKDSHCTRKDGSSILFAAVQGRHFGTALEVLKRFEYVRQLEDEKMTSLHMLANIPSALNSDQMGLWKKFLHFFVPIGYGHEDDAHNIEVTEGKLEDHTKSGLAREDPSVGSDDNPASCKDGKEKSCTKSCLDKVVLKIYVIYLLIWKLINRVCPPARRVWKEKRRNKFAYKLARELIGKSSTWEESIMGLRFAAPRAPEKEKEGKIRLFAATRKANEEAVEYLLELYPEALDPKNHRKPSEKREIEEKRQKIPLFATTEAKQPGSVKFSLDLDADALDQINHTRELDKKGNLEFIKFLLELYPLALEQTRHRKSPEADMEKEEECGDEGEWETPLLSAIRTGNIEFVKLIIDEYPQALTQSNHRKENILHLAATYRQKKIFDLVKEKKLLKIRLARQIDAAGYTVLHCVADTKHHIGGTRSGPAYELKEELEWFKRAEKIVPAYYTTLRAKNKMTPSEIFKKKHKELQKEAQQWMKDTSQSCSAVAVLVATVVFAAAFTVPGGTNDVNGLPILIHSPYFLFFTVMDVIALSCSLTAVVIFLSILTSPFELEDFSASLPRRLTLGFALLFMSVATTMLAFASTIFLVVHLEDRRAWTTTLICSASFFPVSALALTHFPLFVSFINAGMNLFKFIWNALRCQSVIRLLKSSTIYKKAKEFLKSIWKKCSNHFANLFSDDKTGNGGNGHPGLTQKGSSNLPPQETPEHSGLIQGSSSNLPSREIPDQNV